MTLRPKRKSVLSSLGQVQKESFRRVGIFTRKGFDRFEQTERREAASPPFCSMWVAPHLGWGVVWSSVDILFFAANEVVLFGWQNVRNVSKFPNVCLKSRTLCKLFQFRLRGSIVGSTRPLRYPRVPLEGHRNRSTCTRSSENASASISSSRRDGTLRRVRSYSSKGKIVPMNAKKKTCAGNG